MDYIDADERCANPLQPLHIEELFVCDRNRIIDRKIRSVDYSLEKGVHAHINRNNKCDVLKRKFPFQVYSFGSFDNIASSVEANDNIYVIKNNGEFGEIKFGGIGSCSFIPIAKSKFSTNYRGCHYLFRKWLQVYRSKTQQNKRFS